MLLKKKTHINCWDIFCIATSNFSHRQPNWDHGKIKRLHGQSTTALYLISFVACSIEKAHDVSSHAGVHRTLVANVLAHVKVFPNATRSCP